MNAMAVIVAEYIICGRHLQSAMYPALMANASNDELFDNEIVNRKNVEAGTWGMLCLISRRPPTA